MPIQNDLLEILCDPITKTPVQLLSADQITLINSAIAAGKVKSVDGKPVEEALQEGLITTDGKTVYRIDNDIPIMLAEQGITATQIEGL